MIFIEINICQGGCQYGGQFWLGRPVDIMKKPVRSGFFNTKCAVRRSNQRLAFYLGWMPFPGLLSTATRDARAISNELVAGHDILRYFVMAGGHTHSRTRAHGEANSSLASTVPAHSFRDRNDHVRRRNRKNCEARGARFKRHLQLFPLEERGACQPQLRLCEEGNTRALEEV